MYAYLKACFSIISVPLKIRRMEWRRKNFKPVVCFTHFLKMPVFWDPFEGCWYQKVQVYYPSCVMFGHLRRKSQNRIQHTSNLLGEVFVERWGSRAGQGQRRKECRKGGWPCAGSLTAHSEDFPVSLCSEQLVMLGTQASPVDAFGAQLWSWVSQRCSPNCLSSWNTVLSVLCSVGWRKGWTGSPDWQCRPSAAFLMLENQA